MVYIHDQFNLGSEKHFGPLWYKILSMVTNWNISLQNYEEQTTKHTLRSLRKQMHSFKIE